MDFHGVVDSKPGVLEKLDLFDGKVLDGHLPSSQSLLQPYAASGIRTDHESVTFEEARAKLRAGLSVLVRQGSGSKNLTPLSPGLCVKGSTLPAWPSVRTTNTCWISTERAPSAAVLSAPLPWDCRRSPPTGWLLSTPRASTAYGTSARLPPVSGPTWWCWTAWSRPGYTASIKTEKCERPPCPSAPPADSNGNSALRPHSPPGKGSLPPARAGTYPVINIVPNQIITRKTLVSASEAERLLREKRSC